MALLLFQFTAKVIFGVFLWKFAPFGLVFSDLPLCFFTWLSCWFFVLLNFPANACWACFSVKLPIFGLFFKFTCLSLQNHLASLVWSHSRVADASVNIHCAGSWIKVVWSWKACTLMYRFHEFGNCCSCLSWSWCCELWIMLHPCKIHP